MIKRLEVYTRKRVGNRTCLGFAFPLTTFRSQTHSAQRGGLLGQRFSDAKVGGWCKALRFHKEFFAVASATDRYLFQVGINLCCDWQADSPAADHARTT
jgi:hypothetical protein